MIRDEIAIDAITCQAVQGSIIRFGIHAPQTHTSNIRDSGTKLIPQQPEQSKDQVGGSCSISHNLKWIETRLLFEQSFENIEGVPHRSWNNDSVETAELIAGEVIIGNTLSNAKILTIVP